MNGDQQLTSPDTLKGNSLLGVGIRAWIALILTISICLFEGYILYVLAQTPDEPLIIPESFWLLVFTAVGYYLGQKTSQTKT